MINTGYAIQSKNKFYIVPTSAARFTKAIANAFIENVPAIQEALTKYPDKITPKLLYVDMIKMKRYFKIKYEYKPEMITDINGTTEPRYYINAKGINGHFKPENVQIISE